MIKALQLQCQNRLQQLPTLALFLGNIYFQNDCVISVRNTNLPLDTIDYLARLLWQSNFSKVFLYYVNLRTNFLFFRALQQINDEEALEFYLSLCCDVLFEVLRFGARRPLTKLEPVGRRFHWLIEKYFLDVPFLRHNLTLKSTTGYSFY